MRILITGVHGFVGTNLVKEFKADNEIYGLDIVSPDKEGVVKTYSWEALDKGEIPPVDAIIHLAGKAHDTKNRSAADTYFAVNTELTKKIFDYFLASGAKKFIFFSSVKAAADSVPDGEILREDVVPTPVGPYGESKIRAEEYIREKFDFADNSSDKQVYILRPCMIHGPGNKGNLNLLYSVIAKGVPYPLGAYDNLRTFTSIDNLKFIIRNLLTSSEVASGIYHIADDDALSTKELVHAIGEGIGKKAMIWSVPKWIINCVAVVGDKIHLPLNSERLRKLTENYVVTNNKIKQALGVEHLPVKAAEGIRRTIESFKNQENK